MLHRSLVWIAGFLSCVCSANTPATRVFDLDAAVSEALDKNPALREMREKVVEAQAPVSAGWSIFVPQISSKLSFHRTKDSVLYGTARFNGDPYNNYNFGLNARQTLLNMQVFGGLSSNRAKRDIAEVDADISSRELVGKVAKAFSNILFWKRQQEALQGISEVLKDSLGAAQVRYRNGRGPILDVLQVRTQIALLVPQIAQTESGVRTATADLVGLMGAPNLDRIEIQGQLEAPSPDDLKKNVEIASSELPQLRRIALEKERIEADRSVGLGAHWPVLSAEASWGRGGPSKDNLFDSAATQWAAGIVLEVPLFSGFSSVYDRRELASRSAQVRLREVALRNDLSRVQINSLEMLRLAHSKIESNQAAFQLATQSQTEAKSNYRLGVIDLPQFLTIQKNVLDASVAVENARIEYVGALVDYYLATGLPMTQLVSALSRGTTR